MIDEDVDAELAPAGAVKSPNTRRKIVIVAAVALILAGGTTGALYYERSKSTAAPESAYVDLPAMLINIRSADGRQHFLKVRLTLEVSPDAKKMITDKQPAVIDAAQNFLREVRPEDLNGAAAMFRIKEELLVRANRSVGEGEVTDVLIQELVQQ